jgi:viologen exporter family transport system permease protein
MLPLAIRLWKAGLKSSLQYRTDTFIVILMALAFQGTGFAFAWVVLDRFESLAGWGLGEIAFLYGFRLIVHAAAGVMTGPIFRLDNEVRTGEFDRYLMRPVGPLLQFVTQRVEISILGDLVGGLAIFAYANSLIQVARDPATVLYFAFALAGGVLAEAGVRILIGAISFRFLASEPFLYLADSVFSTFANYPLSLFGSGIAAILTVAVPVALVAYLPGLVMLDRASEAGLPGPLVIGAPILGAVWFCIAIRIFHGQLARYQSAGH